MSIKTKRKKRTKYTYASIFPNKKVLIDFLVESKQTVYGAKNKTLDKSVKGNVVYCPSIYKDHISKRKCIITYLLSYNGNGWTYSPYLEKKNNRNYNCPVRFFEMVDKPADINSLIWREKCIRTAESKKSKKGEEMNIKCIVGIIPSDEIFANYPKIGRAFNINCAFRFHRGVNGNKFSLVSFPNFISDFARVKDYLPLPEQREFLEDVEKFKQKYENKEYASKYIDLESEGNTHANFIKKSDLLEGRLKRSIDEVGLYYWGVNDHSLVSQEKFMYYMRNIYPNTPALKTEYHIAISNIFSLPDGVLIDLER